MSGLKYIDSSGIGLLIKEANQIEEIDGIFYLAGVSPPIEKVLKVAGLTSYFETLTDEDFSSRFP